MAPKSRQQNPKANDREQLYEWINAYQQNPTEEVKTSLVLHYEDLVKSLARKFSRGDELYEDLIQVGMIGLIAALNRFEFAQGRSFESFAVPTIVGEIKRYIRDKTWSVHVPRRIKELSPKIKSAVEVLTTDLQRSPSIPEIATHIGATEEQILEASEMSRSYRALSVDNTIDMDQEGSKVTLLDLVGERDEGYEDVHRRMLFDKILEVLDDKEQQVIDLTFIRGFSQKETGAELEMSQMHVSRLQRRAIKKLREVMRETGALQSN